jgi:lysophosphatidate acyltransferase
VQGFVHIALQTKLPIVPIVFTGTHLAWRKNNFLVTPAPIGVKFLPPIKTDEWVEERVSEYVEMIRNMYVQCLPESQKPLLSDGFEKAKNSFVK